MRSIVLPCEDPFAWLLVTLWCIPEMLVTLTVMNVFLVNMAGMNSRVFAIQIVTWAGVVFFASYLMEHGLELTHRGVARVWLMVVVAEVALLRIASAMPLKGAVRAPMRVWQACVVSVIGNAVSLGMLVGIVALLDTP